MEQDKLKPLLSWVEKNSQLLTTAATVVVVVVLMMGIVVWNKIEEGKVVEETKETTEIVSDATASPTAGISALVESGKGEVVFVVSSAKSDVIVREIQLHNPHKNSWVVAYDGYKPVFRIPIEVFRTRLAAINYDMVQVRTLDSFYPIPREVMVKDGDSIAVNLEL